MALAPPDRETPTARRRRAACLAAILMLASLPAAAQIYTGTSAAGTTVLSNHASQDAPHLLVAAPAPVAAATPPVSPSATPGAARGPEPAPLAPRELDVEIRSAASRHSLPVPLLTAVVAVESRFDPRALSVKGAQGLMQLMPSTAQRFGVKDPFSVRENLRGGSAYLRYLMDLFNGDISLALAAYNAGEGAVMRAGRRIPAFPETQQYVARILAML